MKPMAATLGALALMVISGHMTFAGTTSTRASVCVPTTSGPNGPRWNFVGIGTAGYGGTPLQLTYNDYGVQVDNPNVEPQTFVCPLPSAEGGDITGATALVADRNDALFQDVSCTFTISSLTNGAPIYTMSMFTSGWMGSTQTFSFSIASPTPGTSFFTCTVPPYSSAHGYSNLGAFTVVRS